MKMSEKYICVGNETIDERHLLVYILINTTTGKMKKTLQLHRFNVNNPMEKQYEIYKKSVISPPFYTVISEMLKETKKGKFITAGYIVSNTKGELKYLTKEDIFNLVESGGVLTNMSVIKRMFNSLYLKSYPNTNLYRDYFGVLSYILEINKESLKNDKLS